MALLSIKGSFYDHIRHVIKSTYCLDQLQSRLLCSVQEEVQELPRSIVSLHLHTEVSSCSSFQVTLKHKAIGRAQDGVGRRKEVGSFTLLVVLS